MPSEVIHSSLGFRIFLPSPFSHPANRWTDVISERLPGFNGDVIKAAQLMEFFIRGQEYITEKLYKMGESFALPYAGIAQGIEADAATLRIGDSYFTFIQDQHLADLACMGLDDWMQKTYFGGEEVIFEGYPRDYARLVGLEETHHSIYRQLKGPYRAYSPEDLSMTAYDAQEHEFRALKWQLHYAQRSSMPKQTTYALTNRLSAARNFRRARI